ncbi:MAG: ECF-type sigma factor [Acidobacteriota bacterium]|nr:ECF-type sigma factor [Acidobacteriota bacterium]
MSGQTSSITDQLQQWSPERPDAFNTLIDLVYKELRAISHHILQDEKNPGLQTTELVNQVYDTLSRKGHIDWQNRRHFYGIAAKAMRRVLIHDARRRKADKRGGGRVTVSLEDDGEAPAAGSHSPEQWLLLDTLLDELGRRDAMMGHIVELRIFGGFTIAESAEILDIAQATVKRKWAFAMAWLARRGSGA